MSNQPKPKILVVDDIEVNVEILTHLLQDDYQISSAFSGEEALEAVEANHPDLILLDIMMLEMDGYEVCRQLKENPKTRDVPVIFLSSLSEVKSKAEGFKVGAVDYIVKPFEGVEVKARVETHLALKHAKESLKNQNAILEEKVQQRTKELSEANERLKVLDEAKNDFLSLISHELRTPLTGLIGASEVLGDDDIDHETREEMKGVFKHSCDRMLGILDEALLLTKIGAASEKFQLTPTSVTHVFDCAIHDAREFAESREVQLGPWQLDCDCKTLCDEELLMRAFRALIRTAVKFSSSGGMVSFTSDSTENEISISINVLGRTIPGEEMGKFFEVFSIAEPITPGGDLGLEPPVAERIIKLFQGSVTVENDGNSGVCFLIKLKPVGKRTEEIA